MTTTYDQCPDCWPQGPAAPMRAQCGCTFADGVPLVAVELGPTPDAIGWPAGDGECFQHVVTPGGVLGGYDWAPPPPTSGHVCCAGDHVEHFVWGQPTPVVCVPEMSLDPVIGAMMLAAVLFVVVRWMP